MIKILTIVGTRPELIRLSECIKYFDKVFDHKIVHTGQNFDKNLNNIFFKDLNIRKPNFLINSKSNTPIEVISKIMIGVDKILIKFKPDAVLILGDTNSSLSALAAKKRKIPIFHIEAGNRCFNENVPEESNRRVVDHLSDINVTYTSYAKDNLLREGKNSELLIKLGSPLDEVIIKNNSKIKNSKILEKLNIVDNNFFLVSFHRDENTSNSKDIEYLFDSLIYLSKSYNSKIIFSTHPRIKKLFHDKIKKNKYIDFVKPFSFTDYIKLQLNAKLVLSDSGSLIEESSLLGFKSICLRSSIERQEGYEKGLITLTSFKKKDISLNVKMILDNKSNIQSYSEYRNKNFSSDLAKIIISHIPIVKKKIWLI